MDFENFFAMSSVAIRCVISPKKIVLGGGVHRNFKKFENRNLEFPMLKIKFDEDIQCPITSYQISYMQHEKYFEKCNFHCIEMNFHFTI